MPGHRLAVTYELTKRGQALCALYKPMVLWAGDHFDAIMASRRDYDERTG